MIKKESAREYHKVQEDGTDQLSDGNRRVDIEASVLEPPTPTRHFPTIFTTISIERESAREYQRRAQMKNQMEIGGDENKPTVLERPTPPQQFATYPEES